MAELPQLGKHCSFSLCHQLDFLPFTCDGCLKIYCSGHKTKENHQCTLENISVATGEYAGEKGFTCGLSGCSNRELSPIICEKCQLSFCLSHRHAQDHQCSKLENIHGAGSISKTAEHVNKILESKKIEPKKLRGGAKSSKTAAKVALMKMKMHALGDKSCPEVERVYLKVYPPVSSNKQPQPFFFSKVWSIGKTIDTISDRLGLQNSNNIQDAKKLRIFSTDTGAIFATDSDIDSLLKQELVYSGSPVIIEYVHNDCEQLEDISPYKIS